MKIAIYFLLQMTITSGLLYAYYHFVLRNKRFHRYNRFYLLAAVIISILISFINIPLYFTEEEKSSSVVLQTLSVISFENEAPVILTNKETTLESWFTWQNISYLFYGLIAFIALSRIAFSLYKIKRIIRNNSVEKLGNIHFINTEEPGTPFSFFRWLFWNKKIELKSEKGEQIFRHELFHIQQKHSWDAIFMEVLTMLFWINPFFHLIKKEIKAIHEFLADKFAISENKQWEYAELLLMQVLNTNQQLVNPFFHNQIKRRIAMITTSKKSSYQYARKLMVLPVAAIVFGLFAFSYKEKNRTEGKKNLSQQINVADTTQKPSVTKIKWIENFVPSEKKSPTATQLKIWLDSKNYGVWMDNRRIDNAQLSKYNPSDFALYNVSKLEKNAINYGSHFYQVDLCTNIAFEKMQKNKTADTGKYLMVKDTTKPLLGNRFEKALIVIDGTIREDIKANEIDNILKSSDIESITVVKNGDAKTKYGTKGENGVIEIITKKNKSDGYTIIDLEGKPRQEIKILNNVEVEASFPGGEEAFKNYITKNQKKHIIKMKDGGVKGTLDSLSLDVTFLVDANGTVSDVKQIGYDAVGMGADAVDLIKKGPKWNPAIQNGYKVKAYKTQRVVFYPEIEIIKPTNQIQGIIATTTQTLKISVEKLKTITPSQLLQLPEGTEILMYKFAIDFDDSTNAIMEIYNKGSEFNILTKTQIKNATPGRLITIDLITISKEGNKIKLPSKIYKVIS